jgi:multisubunit Na+/H+ antiporter MnhB subunit
MLENGYHLFEHGEQLIGGMMYVAAAVAALFMVGAIITLIWEGFFRRQPDEAGAHLHHAPSFGFVAPALLLTILGAVGALFISTYENLLFAPAIASISGESIELHFKLWYGFTPVFMTSLGILTLGFLIFAVRQLLRRGFAAMPNRLSSLVVYDSIIDAIYHFAYRLTVLIQGSPMAPQASVTLLAGILVALYAIFFSSARTSVILDSLEIPSISEWLIFALAIFGALATVRARSRLSAIISLGVVGITVTLFFVVFGAPDLALTQLLIEVLSVILLVLVFFRVRPDPTVNIDKRRFLRGFVAIGMGFFGFAVVMINHITQVGESISPYFLEKSYAIGRGTNVVNVILVDIRGYDTMGEITVLGLAALGGYALLRSPQIQTLRRRIDVARTLKDQGAPSEVTTQQKATELGHD